MFGFQRVPSGKRLQKKTMENHHAINGKIHYFDWAMFNSYVSLPEGTSYLLRFLLVNMVRMPLCFMLFPTQLTINQPTCLGC